MNDTQGMGRPGRSFARTTSLLIGLWATGLVGACQSSTSGPAAGSTGGRSGGAGGAPTTGSGGASTTGSGGASTTGSGGASTIGSGGGPAGSAGSDGSNGSGGSNGSVDGGAAGSSGAVDAGRSTDGPVAGTGGGAAPSSLLVPAHGALLGAFVGTGTLAGLETTLGRQVTITHSYFGWGDDYTARARADLASGRIPLITWEAWTNGVGTPLADIINGVQDTLIRTRAQAAKDIGQKFFLRWGHEMNGNWYPWDGFHNGANAAAVATYIAAYHHIHDIFTSVGATNVLWVFCPNVDSVPGDAWNLWSNYYPGDAYVDWMGFDGYNWGTVLAGSTWQLFAAIATRIYGDIALKGKPIMIAETASAEVGGDKTAWIAGVLPALEGSFPAVKALVWFQMNKETDWRIDSSPQSQAAFIPLANDAYMNP